nr:restriction endonuclease subunit S [uncultured Oribacterium sp.]
MRLKDKTLSANTGLDAIKRAPIVEYDTGLKCIRIQDISQGKNYDEWGFTETNEKDRKNFLLKKNDLLIARTGATVGVSQFIKEDTEAVYNNGTIRLRLEKSLNPRFVYYIFQTKDFLQYIDNISCVATQPNLRIEGLLRFTIPDYSIEKQNAIVKTLSTFDDLIENNNKRIKLLEQMAENLYKEWFVRFRFPGYEDMEVEEKKPRGWQVGTEEKKHLAPSIFKYDELGNIGRFVRGKNITAEKMLKGDIPVISAGLQPSGHHNEANVYGESLTISASGANAGYLQYHLRDIWAADCSYYQGDATIWFVYNTLKYIQPVISNLQCGVAQPHVYPKNINKLCVLIPTEELINKYNDFVKPYYDEIKILKQHNQLLAKQRDMLLPRLMSGKLKV